MGLTTMAIYKHKNADGQSIQAGSNLYSGIHVFGGPETSSFRGDRYMQLIQDAADVSLYVRYLNNASVYKIYTGLQRFSQICVSERRGRRKIMANEIIYTDGINDISYHELHELIKWFKITYQHQFELSNSQW